MPITHDVHAQRSCMPMRSIVEFSVSGTTMNELEERATEQLAKLSGATWELKTWSFHTRPTVTASDGNIVLWQADVYAELTSRR